MNEDMKAPESHSNIARLMGLKRYERPEKGYTEQLICTLRVRLTEEEHARVSAPWTRIFARPAVRLASAAAALLIIAGGTFLYLQGSADSPVVADHEMTEEQIEEVLLAATNKSFIHHVPGGGFQAVPAHAK